LFILWFDAKQVLLSDEGGGTASAYGVGGLGGYSERWTFCVDTDAVVRAIDT
jgi:peroxiredoxin